MSLCLSCTKSRNLLQASLSLPQKTIVRNSKVSKRRKETQRVLAPHLTVKYVEKTPRIMALIYFDDHYKKLFGKDWHPIRLALLSHSKPSALLNNFAPIDQVRSELTGLGCMSLQDLYKDYNPEERLSASPTAQASSFPARPERRDEDEDTPNPALSMDAELAKKRLISPSEQVLGNAEALALYDFVPTKNIKGMEDFVEEIDYYESYQKLDDIPILIQRPSIDVPKHLDAFYFGSHNLSRFPSPRQTVLNTLNYYCMDLASLLPVLALNLQPEDSVLDMCSGPGGKSLAILQTLLPSRLMCVDYHPNRLQRVRLTVENYLRGVDEFKKRIEFQARNGNELPITHFNEFTKILVDAPCFTDRHVLREDDNNIFHQKRKLERIRLPRLQTDLLANAFRCLKPGGSVVYSTCTLSPMQNDGVVYGALKRLWEDTDMEFYVDDLSKLMEPMKEAMNIHGPGTYGLRFGHLVTPEIGRNFGPMYICRITRTK